MSRLNARASQNPGLRDIQVLRDGGAGHHVAWECRATAQDGRPGTPGDGGGVSGVGRGEDGCHTQTRPRWAGPGTRSRAQTPRSGGRGAAWAAWLEPWWCRFQRPRPAHNVRNQASAPNRLTLGAHGAPKVSRSWLEGVAADVMANRGLLGSGPERARSAPGARTRSTPTAPSATAPQGARS